MEELLILEPLNIATSNIGTSNIGTSNIEIARRRLAKSGMANKPKFAEVEEGTVARGKLVPMPATYRHTSPLCVLLLVWNWYRFDTTSTIGRSIGIISPL